MVSFEKCKRDFGNSDDRGDILEIGTVKMDVLDSEHYDRDDLMVKLT